MSEKKRLNIIPTYFCSKCKKEYMLVLTSLDYYFDYEKLAQGYLCNKCNKIENSYYREIDCEQFELVMGKTGKINDRRTFE